MDSIVRFENVTFQPDETPLLKDASFDIYANEMVRVEGPSGSGKSTLLKLIATLIPRDKGQILFQGTPVEEVNYQNYRQEVSYVAQNPHLFGETVRDNFELVFQAHENATFDEEQVLNYMVDFGLENIDLDHSIHKISGGEKQRIGLIRHLLFPPKVLLLDEITSSLDADNRERVWDNILDYKEKHQVSILWVSHLQDGSITPDRLFHIQDSKLTVEKRELDG